LQGNDSLVRDSLSNVNLATANLADDKEALKGSGGLLRDCVLRAERRQPGRASAQAFKLHFIKKGFFLFQGRFGTAECKRPKAKRSQEASDRSRVA